jgi:hypothetical protein
VDFPFDAYDCQLVYMEKVITALQQVRDHLAQAPALRPVPNRQENIEWDLDGWLRQHSTRARLEPRYNCLAVGSGRQRRDYPCGDLHRSAASLRSFVFFPRGFRPT